MRGVMSLFRSLRGRDAYGNDVYPVVQVVSKKPFLYQVFEVFVGSGDYPDVDGYLPGTAYAGDGFVL